MSKAFTKEDDDAPPPPVRKRGVPVPVDVPNYITADGERALRAELASLGGGDDQRAHEISEHLATATVIGPPEDQTRVGFGARVTLEDADGKRITYRLVGAIEAAPKDGVVYWQTPIAEALHDAQVGDTVTLPRGELEVVAIEY
ncbi:MAG TPA: GreA/GreB family elongation factor [Kofleriaceae bacterium]|nr:GreA/GreB family elongation factor [Kofleriaceae bacterium]